MAFEFRLPDIGEGIHEALKLLNGLLKPAIQLKKMMY